MKELQPVNQNVVLDISGDKAEQKTAGGIYIPDTAREKPKFARVIAIAAVENPEITVGDTVIYKEFSGNELKLDDKTYLIIPYADILAKMVKTEKI
jgi:chaperonin GroES